MHQQSPLVAAMISVEEIPSCGWRGAGESPCQRPKVAMILDRKMIDRKMNESWMNHGTASEFERGPEFHTRPIATSWWKVET